jgi:hypothetical protein
VLSKNCSKFFFFLFIQAVGLGCFTFFTVKKYNKKQRTHNITLYVNVFLYVLKVFHRILTNKQMKNLKNLLYKDRDNYVHRTFENKAV